MPKATVPEIYLRFLEYRPVSDDSPTLFRLGADVVDIRNLNMYSMMKRGIIDAVMSKLSSLGTVITPMVGTVLSNGTVLYGGEIRWIGNWITTSTARFGTIGCPPWARHTNPLVTAILMTEYAIRKMHPHLLFHIETSTIPADPNALPSAPPDSYFGAEDASPIPTELLVAAGVLPDESTPFTEDADDTNAAY